MADGIRSSLGPEVPDSLPVSLSPPAKAPVSGVLLLRGGKLFQHISGKETVFSIAAAEHDRGQSRKIPGVCEQSRMAGNTHHAVPGLLIMHFSLESLCPVTGIGNDSVPCVAIQLRSCAVLFGKPVFQGIVGNAGKPHGFKEILLQPGVQILSRNLLDDEAKHHIVQVRISGLCSRLIDKRRSADGLYRRLPRRFICPISGEIRINRHLLPLCKVRLIDVRAGIAGIRLKTSLMPQKVPDRKLCLPAPDGLGIPESLFCTGENLRIRYKTISQIIGDPGIQIDLSVCQELLERIVHGKHLCHGSQIIQGLCGHLRTVRVLLSVREIGIRFSPGVFVNHPPVSNDGQLGAGEPVFDILTDDGLQKLNSLRGDPCLLQGSRENFRIRYRYGDFPSALIGFNIGDLQGIAAILCKGGYVCLIDPSALHLSGIELPGVQVQRKMLHALIRLDIKSPLSMISEKGIHAVHGKRIVCIALPVRKNGLSLPAGLRKAVCSFYGHSLAFLRPVLCSGGHTACKYQHQTENGRE